MAVKCRSEPKRVEEPLAKLKKSLNTFDVFSIATGAMIGSGFFLLPGIAYAAAGPAVVVSYVLAALLIVPTLLSKAELSTAMPRSGGTYYFVSRSMGPIAGVIDGLGVWVSMLAKSSFALVGIGYYLSVVVGWPPEKAMLMAKVVAVVVAVVLAGVNIRGVKASGRMQVGMVVGLLVLCALFIGRGAFAIDPTNFSNFAPHGLTPVLATAGLVFVSYAGLTKVASVAEEVVDPERTIPKGMFLALGVTTAVYAFGVVIIVGLLPGEDLSKNLTPLASAAETFAGRIGIWAMTVAGILAFVTTANAAVLSASRYLYAMGRDRAVPAVLARLSKWETPAVGIVISTAFIIVVVLSLDAVGIAKLASTFLLVGFGVINLSVIVMRESQVGSYDPGFRSPGYPWVQVAGILISVVLIPLMGRQALIFAVSLVAAGVVWYAAYARGRTEHAAAIMHVLERIATEILSKERAGPALDRELREIMKEKGLRAHDPFNELVARAKIIDLPDDCSWEMLLNDATEHFAAEYPYKADQIRRALFEMARQGQTPAAYGVALPHIRMEGIGRYELVIARSRQGLYFPGVNEAARAVFILMGSTDDPQQHLRMLAGIAVRVEEAKFLDRWLSSESEGELREALMPE